MSKKFNPKVFQNKTRIFVRIQENFFRVWKWSESERRYVPSGFQVKARRNGRRVTRNFSSSEEARGFISGQSKDKKRTQEYRFKDLLEDYRRHHLPVVRKSSRTTIERHIKHFDFFLEMPAVQIDCESIDEWILWLKSPQKMNQYKAHRTSFRKEFETLRAILNWFSMRRKGVGYRLPFVSDHLRAIKIRDPKKKKMIMSEEEARRWIEEFESLYPDMYRMGLVQMEQFLRISEVAAMKWENVNWENGTYNLCEHVVWDRSPGGVVTTIEPGTKTADLLVIPLRQVVIKSLAELRKTNTDTGLIFCRTNGEPYTYRSIQAAYNRVFKKLGMPYSSTHVARHTGSTIALNELRDKKVVQKMGGWQTPGMVDHYAKMLDSTALEVVRDADAKRATNS